MSAPASKAPYSSRSGSGTGTAFCCTGSAYTYSNSALLSNWLPPNTAPVNSRLLLPMRSQRRQTSTMSSSFALAWNSVVAFFRYTSQPKRCMVSP